MLPDRFWQKVNFYGPIPEARPDLGHCWIWMASVVQGKRGGYGRFRVGKRMKQVHVVTYEDLIGPIPAKLQLDHLCRIRRCCNPWHTEPVTKEENIHRGDAGKNNAAKTHCPKGHPYDKKNTYLRKRSRTRRGDNGRQCRTCAAITAKRLRDRRESEEEETP